MTRTRFAQTTRSVRQGLPDAGRPSAASAVRRAPGPVPARLETTYTPRHPLDLHRTVVHQQHGRNDPSLVVDGPVIWRASRTHAGIATVALRASTSGAVRVAAWGPGADWALSQVPALCGADDDPDGFDAAQHPLIASSHHRHPGLRIGRTDLVFDALASAIFEQKVTGLQAFGAWRRIVTWFGERAPGPTPRPMFAPPSLDEWRRIPSWSWHRAGLEPPQSRTVVAVAARGASLVQALDAAVDGAARETVLTSLRGIGPWTSAETRIRAYGDPDAVSVGDFHLAHQVGHALTGTRTDDDGMLRLLAPWAGHRQRVIRLIHASGVQEPRRAPRLHPEDHRDR